MLCPDNILKKKNTTGYGISLQKPAMLCPDIIQKKTATFGYGILLNG